jgi:hypothetical protein
MTPTTPLLSCVMGLSSNLLARSLLLKCTPCESGCEIGRGSLHQRLPTAYFRCFRHSHGGAIEQCTLHIRLRLVRTNQSTGRPWPQKLRHIPRSLVSNGLRHTAVPIYFAICNRKMQLDLNPIRKSAPRGDTRERSAMSTPSKPMVDECGLSDTDPGNDCNDI